MVLFSHPLSQLSLTDALDRRPLLRNARGFLPRQSYPVPAKSSNKRWNPPVGFMGNGRQPVQKPFIQLRLGHRLQSGYAFAFVVGKFTPSRQRRSRGVQTLGNSSPSHAGSVTRGSAFASGNAASRMKSPPPRLRSAFAPLSRSAVTISSSPARAAWNNGVIPSTSGESISTVESVKRDHRNSTQQGSDLRPELQRAMREGLGSQLQELREDVEEYR